MSVCIIEMRVCMRVIWEWYESVYMRVCITDIWVCVYVCIFVYECAYIDGCYGNSLSSATSIAVQPAGVFGEAGDAYPSWRTGSQEKGGKQISINFG